MNADQPNPYESPVESGEQGAGGSTLSGDRRRFHTVVGMWVSFGLAFTFGAMVYPSNPLPDREYLLQSYRGFSVLAVALSLLTACYAIRLITLRRIRDILGGLIGLGFALVPFGWGVAAVLRSLT